MAHERTVASLRTPRAVRERCAEVLDAGERDELRQFRVRLARLPAVADEVAALVRARYPTLDVPFHSRWRHFVAAGTDRWAALAATLGDHDAAELARTRIDLAVTSVLLDAGAGADWSWRDPATGERFARSEGLALASFHLFESGRLSDQPDAPLRADAAALERCSPDDVADAFQVSPANPLVGLEGRASLVRALAAALRAAPAVFGERGRIGNLYDHLAARAVDARLPAREILTAVLECFGGIWPGRIELGGHNLGDVWHHDAVRRDDASNGLVAFHKLSQWLSYSLMEPLAEAGIEVVDLDELTGLAEYRNGGLFVDLGVLEARDADASRRAHEVGSALVVEWRALTVALLDRLAPLVRERLGADEHAFPVVKLLEGGTWAAGRALAVQRRAGGEPPFRVISDGTVF